MNAERLDGAFFGSFTHVLAHAKLGVEVLARPEGEDGSSTCCGLPVTRKDGGIRSDGGVTGDDARNSCYGRDMLARFGPYQRSLCAKCHRVDSVGSPVVRLRSCDRLHEDLHPPAAHVAAPGAHVVGEVHLQKFGPAR